MIVKFVNESDLFDAYSKTIHFGKYTIKGYNWTSRLSRLAHNAIPRIPLQNIISKNEIYIADPKNKFQSDHLPQQFLELTKEHNFQDHEPRETIDPTINAGNLKDDLILENDFSMTLDMPKTFCKETNV